MPTPAVNLHHNLRRGIKYHFVYQIPGVHRKPREGVAVLVDEQPIPGRHGIDLIFSGRPEFGSTTVQSEWLKSIEQVGAAASCYMDKTVR